MKLAVSSCLIGAKVRFDGGSKSDQFLLKELGKFVEYTPFCPENSLFGSPRESIRVVSHDGEKRVFGNKSEVDFTNSLKEESKRVVDTFENSDIVGVVFKSKSPTCAINSVKNYLPNGFTNGKTSGLLFDEFRERFPYLPMEEEGRLEDPWLRENFIMQIFAYSDFLNFSKSSTKLSQLVEFHTSYKFLLQAKSEILFRELGNIVANRDGLSFAEILESYRDKFLQTISQKSSVERSINAIQHMFGFVKRDVSEDEKSEFLKNLQDYRDRVVPMIVPISFLQLFAKKYNSEYILKQKFLSPYPKELALRSKISER